MSKAVMVTTKEGARELLDELGDQLEKEEVFIKIISKNDFDSIFNRKETVEVEFTDEQFNILALEAHERDITFNQLINDILREAINEST
ncbi:MAG: hypothetical protein ACOCQD_04140 [archaeon]